MYNQKWDVARHTLRKLAKLHNQTFDPPFATDMPERCLFGHDYWHQYPVKDYRYTYNSWGFRGPDYEQYLGQRINACIGDSATLNLGGPIEHSWPSQLAKYFDIPTLNFGIDGLSYYEMLGIAQKIHSLFDVDKVFVLYNIYDGNQELMAQTIPIYNNFNVADKIKAFQNYCWIYGACWQFDPPWTFEKDDLKCLYDFFPEAHDFLVPARALVPQNMLPLLINVGDLRSRYLAVSGSDWPSYEQFCMLMVEDPNISQQFAMGTDRRLIREFIHDHVYRYLLSNRDGWHFSRYANQLLAEYFLTKMPAK